VIYLGITKKKPAKNYALKTPTKPVSKADKFDALFGDDEDESEED